MSKLFLKGSAMLAPVPPALICSKCNDRINVMTAAWTGMLSTRPPMTYVSIRPERFSYQMIKESGEFTVNLCTSALVPVADYCGVVSGKNVDKFEKLGITPADAKSVSAPIIEESPLSLECKVTDIVNLGSHDMFIAEIVGIDVDESIMDESGKICIGKANLAAYAHGDYYRLGKKLGSFGFTVKKRKRK